MTFAQAVFLGLLQGLTEFLPISSSGHLAVAQHFLPAFRQPGVLFDVILHVGTLLAVVIYLRREVGLLVTAPFRREAGDDPYRRLLILILAGSVPTAAIGLACKDLVTPLFENIGLVAAMLLVTGALLFVAEKFRGGHRKIGELTLLDALVAGTAQGMAILPGLSRSGATIAVLLVKGVDGETAARFSFLLSLPAVAGAALLSLKDFESMPSGEWPLYLAGAGVAFISGLVAIHLLLNILRRGRLLVFALYCWLAGSALFALGFRLL